MYRPALTTGALFAAMGVVLGAFGAHALKAHLDASSLATFETGVRYQMYHAFALLAVGVIHAGSPNKAVRAGNALFTIGIVLFSGSLYLLSFRSASGSVGLGGLGILTPIGGVFFIAGWLALVWGIMQRPSRATVR